MAKKIIVSIFALAALCVGTSSAFAEIKHVRTMWNTTLDRSTVIGFAVTAASPYIKLESTFDESKWTRFGVNRSYSFGESLMRVVSQFVELGNLSFWFSTFDHAQTRHTYHIQ